MTGPQLFRIPPKAGPEAYKTYEVRQPRQTHFRRGTCAEVDCRRAKTGWRSVIDVSTVKGRDTANWIRLHSGRRFTFTEAGPLVTFVFPGGQPCFAKHEVWLQREPLLRVAGGDWRGNPRGTPAQILRARDWVDNFGEHQLTLAEAAKRG